MWKNPNHRGFFLAPADVSGICPKRTSVRVADVPVIASGIGLQSRHENEQHANYFQRYTKDLEFVINLSVNIIVT